ncbi:MAG: YigZ family protein [Halobacteriales archaeon]
MPDPGDLTPDPFDTVAGPGEASFEVRGSTFIGHVQAVEDVNQADASIDEIASNHPDASHLVPGYRIRTGDGRGELLREWSKDAGEPTGSAGRPVVNVLAGRELENVLAVVARYFGGTELGDGGLARAYGQAATAAVEDAGVVTRRPHRRYTVEVEYDDSGTVRSILEATATEFEAEYGSAARFAVRVPASDPDGVLDRLRSATSGRVKVEEGA